MSNPIADAIIQQLGNPYEIIAMIGAQLLSLDDGLQINFKGSRKANKCRIILAKDVYTMTFYKYRPGAKITSLPADATFEQMMAHTCPVVGEYPDLYDTQLKPIFEEFTGLHLRLV